MRRPYPTARSGRSRSSSASRTSPPCGWINYYGRFYPSALYPSLNRINDYLVRWLVQKYKRYRASGSGRGRYCGRPKGRTRFLRPLEARQTVTAERLKWEPCKSRGLRTVLRGPGVKLPPATRQDQPARALRLLQPEGLRWVRM